MGSPLQSSGQIAMSDIRAQLGLSGQIDLNLASVRSLLGVASGQIDMNAAHGKCSCNCNYCTCQCNYCTCQCNYCTCQCNYACTCVCNYACTCNCNYSCTCNCNNSCVPAGTEFLLADGTTIPIEQLKSGMIAAAFDEDTKTYLESEVVATISAENTPLYKISTDHGDLICSGGHRIYSKAKDRWIAAKSIEPDDLTLWLKTTKDTLGN